MSCNIRSLEKKTREPWATKGGTWDGFPEQSGPASRAHRPATAHSTPRCQLTPLPPSTEEAAEVRGPAKVSPKLAKGANSLQTQLLISPPLFPHDWRLGLDCSTSRVSHAISSPVPTCLPGAGGPHLGPAGRGPVPSAPPGPQAAGRGGAGGLCEAACSATPPPADGCRLQQRRRPRRSACAGGWAPCPQPRAWRPPRGPPPPRPPRPAQGRPRACLLAPGAQPLPPPPRLPALPPPLFPRHPAVHCGSRWPSPPWPWPAGLLAR